MVAIKLNAVVDEDHKLVVNVPEDIPTGPVELVIRSTIQLSSDTEIQSVHEAARAKLLAAGALVTEFEIPDGARRLSIEERKQLGTLPSGARSLLDLINEDRGEW
jgi:hypothetical protein